MAQLRGHRESCRGKREMGFAKPWRVYTTLEKHWDLLLLCGDQFANMSNRKQILKTFTPEGSFFEDMDVLGIWGVGRRVAPFR